MSKKIEISTINISIKVLMLDNKRFTKSVYNQLPHYQLSEPVSKDWNVLGFVRDNTISGKSLLVIDGIDNPILERWEYPVRYHESFEFLDSVKHFNQIFITS